MAGGKRAAADLGAHICFEDEAGQALSPPRGRTWAPRGRRPTVRGRGRGRGRVNIAGVSCYRPGHRTHFFYKLHVYHGRKNEPKSFSWQDYRDLITATHQQLGTPIVWCWDNLSVHLRQELADYAEENKDWLRIYQLPSYAPDLNPTEGVWSLLKRSITNFVAADLAGLTRIIKRKLKKIQYRPELIDGCLAQTGLTMEPTMITQTDTTSST
ncbi:transposase (plasmid) [Streptomyces sp. NBC_01426]